MTILSNFVYALLLIFLVTSCQTAPTSGIARFTPSFKMYENDTVNLTDENGHRQGRWIVFADEMAHNNISLNITSSVNPVADQSRPSWPKREEGYYANNKREGLWTYYAADGRVLRTISFKADVALKP